MSIWNDNPGWVLVAHTCNPSYSGGRNQEHPGWSQPRQIVHETLSWKNPITKKGWWRGLRCRPWVQTLVLREKKKDNLVTMITASNLFVVCKYHSLWKGTWTFFYRKPDYYYVAYVAGMCLRHLTLLRVSSCYRKQVSKQGTQARMDI
jgi:hypothetical protein